MRFAKRIDPRLWLAALIGGVVGIAAVLLASLVLDEGAGREILVTLGSSLLIAAILAVSVDLYIKRGLTEDAFKATFGYLLPNALRKEFEWFYTLGVICERFELTLDLVEDGDLMIARFRLERTFRNETDKPQNALADISIDDWHFDTPARIDALGYEKGATTDDDSHEKREAYAVVRTMRKPIRLAPGESAAVWATGQQTVRRSADLTFFVRTATLNPLVIVNNKPNDLDVTVTFASRQPAKTTGSKGEGRFSHNGALVPFQGLTVRWWPKVPS